MDPEKNDAGAPPPASESSQPVGRDEAGGRQSGTAGIPETGGSAERFRQQVAAKKMDLEDYDPEEEIWSGGYSPKAMLGTWVLLIIVSAAALVGTVMVEPITWTMTIIGLLVIWVIAGLVYAMRRMGVHYELTSQRFIHQSGIITRHTDRIEVIDIDDVSYQQGPVQRILGVGSIQVTSSDRSHPELTLVGIAEVKSVAGLIDDIRRTERRRRSLHIESI